MKIELVTIASGIMAHEVGLIKSKLESEDIECFVFDELMSQVNPLNANAIGGVKIKVKSTDVLKALHILQSAGYITEDDFKPNETDELREDLNKRLEQFVWLKSTSVFKMILIIIAFIILLIIYIKH